MYHLHKPVVEIDGLYYVPVLMSEHDGIEWHDKEKYAIYKEKTDGEVGHTGLVDFVDKIPMFYKFQATRRYVQDLGPVIREETLNGVGGYVYLDCLYIEDTATWSGHSKTLNRWYLLLGRCDWDSNTLEDLERRLYDWAVSEEYEIVG